MGRDYGGRASFWATYNRRPHENQ